MWMIPLEVIANFPVPNYKDPVTRNPEILVIVSSIIISIAVTAVSIRLYSRIIIRHWFGLDDALIIVALISALSVTATVGLATSRYDWDRHVWDIRLNNIVVATKFLYISRLLWGIASSLVRLSVLCLYYRLLEQCQAQQYRWVLHCATAFTISLFVVFSFAAIFTCSPVDAYWAYPPMANSRCINDGTLMQIVAVLTTFSEFVLASLPIIAVHRFGVDKRHRWNVLCLLSLGFLVVIAGSARTYYIWKSVSTYDLSWWAMPHWICSEIEIDTALICACAPSLKAMGLRFYYWMTGTSYGPTKRVRLGTSTDDTVQSFSVRGDFEAATTWGELASRTIDLEGIRSDGFGCSVTITGPMSETPKRSKLSRRKKKRDPSESQIEERSIIKQDKQDNQDSKVTQYEITANTSIQQTESFRDLGWSESSQPGGGMSRFSSNEAMRPDMDMSNVELNNWDVGNTMMDELSSSGKRRSSEKTVESVGRSEHPETFESPLRMPTRPSPSASNLKRN